MVQYIKIRTLLISSLISIIVISVSCDFQNPADFETPTWRMNLNIPLLHETYPLADIVNDSTIHSSGDTILVKFNGELPPDSISGDYLQVPMDLSVSEKTTIEPPNASDFFPGHTQTITLTVPVGEMMNTALIPNIAVSYLDTVVIPGDTIQQITGLSWNTIAAVIEAALGDTSITVKLFDQDSVFAGVPFIESIEGIIIGGLAIDNFFQSSVENKDLPKNVDSSFAYLRSNNTAMAEHDTSNLPPYNIFDRTTSLVGKTLGEEIEIGYGFMLERATADSDTVTILPNTNLEVELIVSVGIKDLEKAVVTILPYSLAPEMEPIAFENAEVSAEGCAVTGIYGGSYQNGTTASKNKITISNISSTYPFDLDFGIKFRNFVSGTDTLEFTETLSRTNSIPSRTQKLDGYSFVNPVSADSALTELLINVTANTVADTVDIYLDGTEPDWTFTIGVTASDMEFENLSMDLDCPFPPQQQAMEGIPQGFSGMSFGEVILKFTMYNQIRMPLSLNLDLVGVSSMGDSVKVLVYAPLGYPEVTTDTAKTVMVLSSLGTQVTIFKSVSDSVADSTYLMKAGVETQTIVDLLALNPSEIIVDAGAEINGKGNIDVGAKIWGEFELIAPFSVRLDTITFIPDAATPMDEMPQETRYKIRNSLAGALLTSRVINALPIGGEFTILLSDSTIFPVSLDPDTLSVIKDSLGWGASDSLYVINSCDSILPGKLVMSSSSECIDGTAYLIHGVPGAPDTVFSFIDTLFKVILPNPAGYYSSSDSLGIPGMVKYPGDTTITSGLDSNSIFLLSDLGTHYINTQTTFNGTDGKVVFFSMQDYLEIQAWITFIFESSGLFGDAKDELLITFPNGGETLYTDSTYVIRWRSLGSGIGSQNVMVYLSTVTNPDINEVLHWNNITQDPIENVDSLIWIPSATGDSLWIKVCNESENICDESSRFFEVVTDTVLARRNMINDPEISKTKNLTDRPINYNSIKLKDDRDKKHLQTGNNTPKDNNVQNSTGKGRNNKIGSLY